MGIMALFLVAALVAEKLAEAVESGGSPEPHPGFFLQSVFFVDQQGAHKGMERYTTAMYLSIPLSRFEMLNYGHESCDLGIVNLAARHPLVPARGVRSDVRGPNVC